MSDFTITDAINSVVLQTREHVDPEDPGAAGTGSEVLLARYGLTNEDVEKPLQQYTLRLAFPMIMQGDSDSAFLAIFLAGAVFADRKREASSSSAPACPACGGAPEDLVLMTGTGVTNPTRYFKCANGHRWDVETGALI